VQVEGGLRRAEEQRQEVELQRVLRAEVVATEAALKSDVAARERDLQHARARQRAVLA
jgi:hypothetical protein